MPHYLHVLLGFTKVVQRVQHALLAILQQYLVLHITIRVVSAHQIQIP
jgi:hypothetical protein